MGSFLPFSPINTSLSSSHVQLLICLILCNDSQVFDCMNVLWFFNRTAVSGHLTFFPEFCNNALINILVDISWCILQVYQEADFQQWGCWTEWYVGVFFLLRIPAKFSFRKRMHWFALLPTAWEFLLPSTLANTENQQTLKMLPSDMQKAASHCFGIPLIMSEIIIIFVFHVSLAFVFIFLWSSCSYFLFSSWFWRDLFFLSVKYIGNLSDCF